VRANNVDQALKALKREIQREGTFGEMRRRHSYEKPSERRVRKRAEAADRHRKAVRKRLEREGY
jgi:small subunit ribosomal protein S21